MKKYFFSFMLFLTGCGVAQKNLKAESAKTPFLELLKDNIFTKVKMDSLIKNDDADAHHLCDYVPNGDISERSYNPACILIPFKTFKFNWAKTGISSPVIDYSDYLVPDSNFILYYTQFNDSIIGFSTAFRTIVTNKWKFYSGSQNNSNPESGGTIQNNVFKQSKSYNSEVFIIRYSERRYGFAFFVNKELNMMTYYGQEITRYKNFNEWAAALSKVPYL